MISIEQEQIKSIVNGKVLCFAVDKRRLFIGGDFDRVCGRPRHNLAVLEKEGLGYELSPFVASTNGPIRLLCHQPYWDKLVLVGDFDKVNGQRIPTRGFARIFAFSNGMLDPTFNPDIRAEDIEQISCYKEIYLKALTKDGKLLILNGIGQVEPAPSRKSQPTKKEKEGER